MGVGFRSVVDGFNVTQITNEDFNFSLFAQGVLDNTGWASEGGGNSGYRDLVISGYAVADGPMMAISSASAVWCNIVSTAGGNLTYRIFRVGSDNVEWFFFTKKSPTDISPGAGLRLYKKVGGVRVLTYSSLFPVARPIGIYEDGVYSGISITGRKLAIVPIKQRTYSYNTYTAGGLGSCTAPGGFAAYQFYNAFGYSRTAIIASVGVLSTNNRFQNVGPIPYICSLSPFPSPSSSSLSDGYKALILDVTNY